MRHAGSAILASALILASCDSSEPPRPESMSAMTALVQTAPVGAAVAQPPAVRVTTSRGQPVPGVTVSFAVSAGGGTVTAPTTRTDEQGVATATGWTLGTTAGEQALIATAPELAGVQVMFRANAVAGPPAGLFIVVQPPPLAVTGVALSPAPAVQLRDAFGNDAPVAGIVVAATTDNPAVHVENGAVPTDDAGVARFEALRVHGATGAVSFAFSVPGMAPAPAQAATALAGFSEAGCPNPLALDLDLGEVRRTTLDRPGGLTCLEFDPARHAGQQFLLMLENMPLSGGSTSALFPVQPGGVSPASFGYTLLSIPRGLSAAAVSRLHPQAVQQHVGVDDRHSWDFGEGPIFEHHPDEPAGGVAAPMLLRPSGALLDINAATADPQVGDTIVVRMEGIPRLGIATGNQRAVIRHVSDHLVIAEDVRLPTLQREDGGYNTALHPDTMAAIAREYAGHARRQGDLLFAGRYNNSIEGSGGRIVAVHSVMYASNIWGYTYSTGNFFVWDYWVGNTGGSRGGANQLVQRNADNLFMHEIAHMREVGILQQDPAAVRGHRWFTEGFARFSERLPIAARLLGSDAFSRTDNVKLPLNPIFGGTSYFRDDVPTFLNMTTSVMDGYQHSSYIFDYFADQVALSGRDWRAALREFILAAGRPAALDNVVHGYLGISFGELFTRARIALYLDDIGTPDLPSWTQYLQYRLRDSRPAGTAADPRLLFRRFTPGEAARVDHAIPVGTAWAYVIDGSGAAAGAIFTITGTFTSNAVVSVTRIR